MQIRAALIFLFFLLASCKPQVATTHPEHQAMFDAYHELYRVVRSGQLDSIGPMLDPNSKSFFTKITDPKNLNLDSIVSIGMRYKVPYYAMKYLGSCGDHMKEKSTDPTDFFKYLAATDLSIFSNKSNFQLYKEESRIEKSAFVAIYRKDGEVNKVNWIKFVRPDSTTFQYDLIYNLKLEERINRKAFKFQRAKHAELSDEAFIKMYYPTFDKQECVI